MGHTMCIGLLLQVLWQYSDCKKGGEFLAMIPGDHRGWVSRVEADLIEAAQQLYPPENHDDCSQEGNMPREARYAAAMEKVYRGLAPAKKEERESALFSSYYQHNANFKLKQAHIQQKVTLAPMMGLSVFDFTFWEGGLALIRRRGVG